MYNRERSSRPGVEFRCRASDVTSRLSMGYSPLSHASFVPVVQAEETRSDVYSSSASSEVGCMSGLHELFSSLNGLGVGEHGGQNPERQRKVRKRVDADTSAGTRTTDSGDSSSGCGGGRLRWTWGRGRTGSGCFCRYYLCGSCLSLFKMRTRPRRHSAYRSTQVTLRVVAILVVVVENQHASVLYSFFGCCCCCCLFFDTVIKTDIEQFML